MAIISDSNRFELHPIGRIERCIDGINFVKLKYTSTSNAGGINSTSTQEGFFVARILTRGAKVDREYFSYEIGEKVYCLYDNTEKYSVAEEQAILYLLKSEGFKTVGGLVYIAGAFYDKDNEPPYDDGTIREIKFSDGSYIRYDKQESALIIEVAGDILINGKTVSING